ncbi:hypothetical protein L1987_18548 [Smallanthus sonchifolius]|uniref:Uncharacterized protein n=1 Tax=Smallanthus sonchifolius TaxID=185202 RepID=A0ACB9J292_9ASTR|nr:hypothetical protein L1987_18548 [Smallanthus sonchifolius]
MLTDNLDPDFGIKDEVDDLFSSGNEDGDDDDDESDEDGDDDDDESDEDGALNDKVIQEEQVIETDEHEIVKESKVKMNIDSEIPATATESQSKKRKELEKDQTTRTPPSIVGIVIRSSESKRHKSIASKKKPDSSKCKDKEKLLPDREKSRKKFNHVDEDIANYATQSEPIRRTHTNDVNTSVSTSSLVEDVRDDYNATIGLGFKSFLVDKKLDVCSNNLDSNLVSVSSICIEQLSNYCNSISIVSSNCFEKYLSEEIPTFSPVKSDTKKVQLEDKVQIIEVEDVDMSDQYRFKVQKSTLDPEFLIKTCERNGLAPKLFRVLKPQSKEHDKKN